MIVRLFVTWALLILSMLVSAYVGATIIAAVIGVSAGYLIGTLHDAMIMKDWPN